MTCVKWSIGGPQTYRQTIAATARRFNALVLSLCMLVGLKVIFDLTIDDEPVANIAIMLAWAVAMLCVWLWATARLTERMGLAERLLLGLALAAITAMSVMSGGIRSGAIYFLVLVPIAAAALLGRRGALLWIGLSAIALLAAWGLGEVVDTRPDPDNDVVVFMAAAIFSGAFASVLTAAFLTRSSRELSRSEAARERTRRLFERYVSDDVVAELLDSGERIELGGSKRQLSVLVCDIRGFSEQADDADPERVLTTLNGFLQPAIETVLAWRGTVNEVLGDGLFVFFGAPITRDDDAARAVACGLALQGVVAAANTRAVESGLPPVEIGVGISTGAAVVGNIGSDKRAKYAAVGREVNVAARIESICAGGQVLISDATYRRVAELVTPVASFSVRMKGFELPLRVHEVRSIGEPYGIDVPETHVELIKLPIPVEVELSRIVGKVIDDHASTASVTAVSAAGAEIETDDDHEQFENMLLTVKGPEDQATTTAKIVREPCERRITVRFTSRSERFRFVLLVSIDATH